VDPVGSDSLISGAATADLLVLATFLLPGFVTQLFKEWMYDSRPPAPALERLLSSLYYSLLVYLPLAALAALIGWDKDQIRRVYQVDEGLWALLAVAAIAGLFLPAIIAYLGARWEDWDFRFWLIKRLGLRPTHRTPTAWDHFFETEQRAFVRVGTRSGEVLGGYFGGFSFAGYGNQGRERDLYLEEQWALDPESLELLEPINWSMGVWVDGSDIVNVEFFAVTEEEAHAFKEATEGRTGD
jgi:hypothetical protein